MFNFVNKSHKKKHGYHVIFTHVVGRHGKQYKFCSMVSFNGTNAVSEQNAERPE